MYPHFTDVKTEAWKLMPWFIEDPYSDLGYLRGVRAPVLASQTVPGLASLPSALCCGLWSLAELCRLSAAAVPSPSCWKSRRSLESYPGLRLGSHVIGKCCATGQHPQLLFTLRQGPAKLPRLPQPPSQLGFQAYTALSSLSCMCKCESSSFLFKSWLSCYSLSLAFVYVFQKHLVNFNQKERLDLTRL